MGVFDFFSSMGGGKKPPADKPSAPERPANAAKPANAAATSPPTRRGDADKEKDKKDLKSRAAPIRTQQPKPEPPPAARPQKQAVAASAPPPKPAQRAPEKKDEGPPPSTAPDLSAAPAAPVASDHAEVDQALDAVFGKGASRNVTHVSQIAKEIDEAAVRELYASIAGNHARPIKNLIFELKRGTATKEWIEVCRPVMATLIQGAESMGLGESAKVMADFDEALALAEDGNSQTLEGAARDLILRGFDEMAQVLPEAFQAGEEERRRESVIVHALLKQVPDVGHVTFERLYGAGLTSLEALFLAKKDDLAATTGIPSWLAERICERIQEHRKDLERARRDAGQVERRAHLQKLVAELRKCHEGFERAATADWRDPSFADEKKEHRQGRQLCALQIDVLLAEMGELDFVEQIQKLPFGRRIEKLEEFLDRVGTPSEVPAGGV